MIKKMNSVSVMLLFLFVSTFSYAQNASVSYLLMNEQKLEQFRKLYKQHDIVAVKEIDSLVNIADKALKAGPFSVTFQKTKLPPSGDVHDYISQAPYWWPDSTKANGLPYIRKDGRRNPEIERSKDHSQMSDMTSNARTLALAYYFTGNEKYAAKAAELLKVWFLDRATRMNPNLNYGQYIPGITEGRGIGIIETVALTNIPDALAAMKGSESITPKLIIGLKQWFRQYTDWLVNSKNGKDEKVQINNHGTYYDLQLTDFALFLGDKGLAQKVINEQTVARIDQQFTVDGAQPLELIRTKSWGYSNMNLLGWIKLGILAEQTNVNLWNKTTMDGKGIQRAIEWFTPYMLDEKKWNYEQIEAVSYNNMFTIYRYAKEKYPNTFNAIVSKYQDNLLDKPW